MSNIKIETRKNLAIHFILLPITYILAVASVFEGVATGFPTRSKYIEFEDKNLKVVFNDRDIIIPYQDIKKIRVVRSWNYLYLKRIELYCSELTQHLIALPNRNEIMQFKDELIKRCPNATFDFNGIE